MKFPILHDPGSIELLLSTVYKAKTPRVVDHDYLVGLGFKREVDEGLLKLLLFLGFIDENGQPSSLWDKSHDPAQASLLLTKSIRAAYSSLFSEYPEADKEEGSRLMEFFRNSTGASDPDAAYMILTFKVLCDLAELPGSKSKGKSTETVTVPAAAPGLKKQKPKGPKTPPVSSKPESKPVIRISINIDLDDKSDPDLRDLAMKLLKKQLEL